MPNWAKSAQPVLQAGASGAFDALAAMGPSVLKVGGQYLMWYDARQPGPERSIPSVGLACERHAKSSMGRSGPSRVAKVWDTPNHPSSAPCLISSSKGSHCTPKILRTGSTCHR